MLVSCANVTNTGSQFLEPVLHCVSMYSVLIIILWTCAFWPCCQPIIG